MSPVSSPVSFVVPGALDQVTGGYIFDRRVVEGLRSAGRAVQVVELPGRFPDPDDLAQEAAAAALAAMPDGAAVAIDGLALLAFADALPRDAARLRIVAFVHHPLALDFDFGTPGNRRYAAAEAWLLPLCRGVLCPSADSAMAVIDYGVPRDRVVVTPPGTLKPAAPPDRAGRRGPLQLLTVATVTPRKGHLVLAAALARLADRDWRLTCIGSLTRDAATAAALRRALAESGLAARVTLAGEWRPDTLGPAYEAADIFVLPSYHEGYGMAFAEALAYGLPILATTGGAIPETVPATAGILVPPGDAGALAGALARLLDEPDLRARLASGAAAAGARLAGWDTAIAHWIAAFDRLAA